MKSIKRIFACALLTIVAPLSSLSQSAAAPVANILSDSQTVITCTTAKDKVYLSYAPLPSSNENNLSLAHYSHRSHTSHYSHKSHYSSY